MPPTGARCQHCGASARSRALWALGAAAYDQRARDITLIRKHARFSRVANCLYEIAAEAFGSCCTCDGSWLGIGEAAARLFAAEGAKVGVLSRTASEVKKLARDIAKAGGEALPLTADIGDEDEIKTALTKLHRKWKRRM